MSSAQHLPGIEGCTCWNQQFASKARAVPALLYKLVIVAVLVAVLSPASVVAQDEPTLKELVERDQAGLEAMKEAGSDLRRNPADRSTPRRAVLGLTAMLDKRDYSAAADYLDMRFLPKTLSPDDGPMLVKQLAYVISRHISIDIAALSDEEEGSDEDGLTSYRDFLGEIETSGGPVDLYLQRISNGRGGWEWRFSSATVAQIPMLWEEFGHGEIAEKLSRELPVFNYFGLDNWQWLYLSVFLAILVPGVWGLHLSLAKLGPGSGSPRLVRLGHFMSGPLGFFIYIVVLREFMLDLGLSLKARAIFDSVLLAYLAYIFLVLGIIDLLAARVRRNFLKSDHPEAVVIVQPISTAAKMICISVLIIMGMDNAGYDVTTIIAGLGVSSIAIALAAQKTLENLIGAITIYIAKPFRPGDTCRIGEHVGVVEEIGLRSTDLRTLDRSIVNIPNGMLSSTEVENISRRDSIRFFRLIALKLATGPDQLRYTLAKTREVLYAHPMVIRNTVSVRLFNMNDFAFIVRLDSRISTRDYQRYLAAAEDIYLHIIDAVHKSGAEFAYPSQTISLEESAPNDAARRAEVEALVEQWREQDSLPYPDWPDEYIEKISNTLSYPPSGSVGNPRTTDPKGGA
jgi:MscS family membrane protein